MQERMEGGQESQDSNASLKDQISTLQREIIAIKAEYERKLEKTIPDDIGCLLEAAHSASARGYMVGTSNWVTHFVSTAKTISKSKALTE